MATGPRAPISVRAALGAASEHLARRPLLVVSDFDGTLSALVDDPWAATILPLGRSALRSLAGMPRLHIVLLSGRTAADLAARVRVGGASYLGNHGMERAFLVRHGRPERLRVEVDEVSPDAARAAERLADKVPRLVPEPWLVVERKPATVCFHFRTAPDLVAAAARLRDAVDQVDPHGVLQRFHGWRALELRPFGAPAKGEALAALVEDLRPGAVVLLGDDVSDVPAFRVLGELRARGVTDGIAVAVQARAEMPVEVLDVADLVLASPVDATRFLAGLARRLMLSERAG